MNPGDPVHNPPSSGVPSNSAEQPNTHDPGLVEPQDDREQLNRQILVETIGSVLWFLMDGFWMLNLASAAKGMILPTLVVNLLVFRYAKRSLSQYSVVAAMNSWLLMNICWMVSDLDKNPKPLAAAKVMFALGIVLLAVAWGREASDPERLTKVMSHFRRLRS
jgi:hypothetical protein